MAILKFNGVEVAAPVQLVQNGELIWSSNTGRSSSGKMIGTIIARKRTNSIEWGILTQSQMTTLVTQLDAAFITATFIDYKSGTDKTLTVYRDTFTCEPIGLLSDGIYYYRSASVTIIEQ